MLSTLIVISILVIGVILLIMNSKVLVKNEADIEKIKKDKQDAIVYVENSDIKKCEKCKEIKKYLDDKNINYSIYDAKKHSKKEYEKMLIELNINPEDFNYPAVMYIKEGEMYANIINIADTKNVENFIKSYELEKVK